MIYFLLRPLPSVGTLAFRSLLLRVGSFNWVGGKFRVGMKLSGISLVGDPDEAV